MHLISGADMNVTQPESCSSLTEWDEGSHRPKWLAVVFITYPKKIFEIRAWQHSINVWLLTLSTKKIGVCQSSEDLRVLLLLHLKYTICQGSNLFTWQPVWPDKNRQMSIKVAQKWYHKKNEWFWHLCKNCLRMWKIWAN